MTASATSGKAVVVATLLAAAAAWGCTNGGTGIPSTATNDGGSGRDSGPHKANDAGHADSGEDAGNDDGGMEDGGLEDGGMSDSGMQEENTDSGWGEILPDGGWIPPKTGATGSDCLHGMDCLPLGEGVCLTEIRRCTNACNSNADCPPTWTCSANPEDGGTGNVCVCGFTNSGVEICDGLDNDCNSVVDEGDLCPGLEVCSNANCECPPADACGLVCVDMQSDPFNCGMCGMQCAAGYECTMGQCACTGGATCPTGLNGVVICVDTTSDPLNCGGCNMPCDPQLDCTASKCVTPDREWARWSLVAPPSYSSGMAEVPAADGGMTAFATVTNSTTGLTWSQRAAADPVGSDNALGLSLTGAMEYCQALGTGWRLPTRIELLSVVDYSLSNPAVNTVAFPGLPSNTFWTATPEEGQSIDGGTAPGNAWAVDLGNGYAEILVTMYAGNQVQQSALCVWTPVPQ